ncbi:MAG: amidophosphoribosyltransferase [Methanobacteriota archaeon]|nr:MAG: amidophosphoribosyltransferase [Euryarchaeota archaeon]
MCGIVGICGKVLKLTQAQSLLQLLVHRGQDASGLAWIDETGKHCLAKVKGQPIQIPLPEVNSRYILGSTRYPTYGNRNGNVPVEKFAQPFSVETRLGQLTICHNGQIANIRKFSKHEFHSDAEFIANLLGEFIDNGNDLVMASKKLMDILDGAYSITGFLGHTFFGIRDPRGIRPMVYGFHDGFAVIASESLVLQQAGMPEIKEMPPGGLLIFDEDELTIQQLVKTEKRPCMFEYVYFASAASEINERSVYETRLRLGELLGDQIRNAGIEADAVVPVPDTSRTASQTLSEKLGIPLRDAILKNRSSMRTFIMPAEDERLAAAKSKYLFIEGMIKGKRLLLVDDSIIRGLTLKYLISLLRQKGATEIHVAITNPPTRYPCYYGVDFTTKKELIASQKSVEEIRREIGADSLTYLTHENLKRAIDLPELCMACIDGNYPTPFGQHLKRLLEEGMILETMTHYESDEIIEVALAKEE